MKRATRHKHTSHSSASVVTSIVGVASHYFSHEVLFGWFLPGGRGKSRLYMHEGSIKYEYEYRRKHSYISQMVIYNAKPLRAVEYNSPREPHPSMPAHTAVRVLPAGTYRH